jgi:peptide/nickel transport system permease protein
MWRFYGQRFLSNRLALAGGVVLLLIALSAGGASLLSRDEPNQQHLTERLQPPSSTHFLGTDDLGRDVFSRLLHGGRVSLQVGILAVAIAVTLGTLVGLVAGYFGGVVDAVLMRVVDIVLCFPTLFLILMVIAFLEPSLWNVMAVIGFTSWPGWRDWCGGKRSACGNGISS